MDFLGIGAPEIILVLLMAFVIFGPKRIIELSHDAGKALRNLSKNAAAIQKQIEEELYADKTGKPPGAGKSSPNDRANTP
ncbi:MAG: twin-arginine translocase TatA/TatE family subunit [Chloroflexi bacterium]|nr:twin-arginine translocase TatA/TatE family subunit [Chloroflexota bacterium]